MNIYFCQSRQPIHDVMVEEKKCGKSHDPIVFTSTLATLTLSLSSYHLTNLTTSTQDPVTHINVSISWIHVSDISLPHTLFNYFMSSQSSSSSLEESTNSTATWKCEFLALEAEHQNAFGTSRVKRSAFFQILVIKPALTLFNVFAAWLKLRSHLVDAWSKQLTCFMHQGN